MREGLAHPTLVVCGYSEAGMLLRRRPGPNVAAVISICGRREFRVEASVAHRLDLCFDDVDVPPDSAAGTEDVAMLQSHARRRWAEQNGLVEVPPTPEDAGRIIAFAESIRDVDGILLCH